MKKGEIIRIHKSKRNGELISFTDGGKAIIIKNQKDLHVGYAEVDCFTEKEDYILATVKNVPYDFYYEYNDEAIPYEELKEVLSILGFTQECEEDIGENNIFDIWVNLDTGVIIAIKICVRDGREEYNYVRLYVTTENDFTFDTREYRRVVFCHGDYYIYCFDLVRSRLKYPIRGVLGLSSNLVD